MQIKISLIHPSRGRSNLAFETCKLWASNASNPQNIQYILSLDTDEPELNQYENNFNHIKKLFGNSEIVMAWNSNVVMAANEGARKAAGEVLVLMSDDFCCEQGWDEFILQNIDFEKEEALRVNDGLQPVGMVILTLPIITKKLFDRLGYIYHPDFEGIFADNHLAEMCDKLGIMKRNPNKVFLHKHWVNGHKTRDSTNNRHDNPEMWQKANQTIAKHRRNNYGL